MRRGGIGEVTIAQLLPGELQPHTHVVVTSRPNPEPQAQVGPEHPFSRPSKVLRLHALEHAEIETLLRARGSSTEQAPTLAARVLDLTHGEPLLARFVSEDVATGGEQALAHLEREPPTGVKDYFRRQFEQLNTHAESDTAWGVLSLLLVARGPMSDVELAAVLDLSPRLVRRAIEPIRRFLLGRERLELMHLELRSVVAEQLSSDEQQAAQSSLLAWCIRFAQAGWPDDTPDYILSHYAGHLQQAHDHEALYALISQRWMDLKARRTHSHRSFAQDVLHAIDAAASEAPSNLLQEVRGSIIYATLASMATGVPSKVLGALAEVGQLSTAEGYAGLIADPRRRSRAYGEIALGLLRRGQTNAAKAITQQAITAAEVIKSTSAKAEALGAVASALAQAGQADQALTVAKAIKDASIRAQALGAVVEALAWAGQAEQALTAAQAIKNASTRAQALTAVVEAFARAGQADQALNAAEQALTAAEAIKDARTGSQAAEAVVEALARAGQAQQALAAAQAIKDAWSRAQALGAVIEAFARAGQAGEAVDAAEQALTAAQAIKDAWARTQALGAVASALAQAGQAEQALAAAEQALTAAQAIKDASTRAQALGAVTEVLVRTGQAGKAVGAAERALAAAQEMEDPRPKSDALFALASAFAQAGQAQQALTAAQAIKAPSIKSGALANVANALGQAGQVDQALIAAQAIKESSLNSEVLRAVASALARAGQVEGALAAAEAIKDTSTRAQTLAEVAAMLARSSQAGEAVAAVERALAVARRTSRPDVLVVLEQAVPVFGITGKNHELVALSRSLLEVEQWWTA
jgi:tetratricopeptide (TPR) repeat protein